MAGDECKDTKEACHLSRLHFQIILAFHTSSRVQPILQTVFLAFYGPTLMKQAFLESPTKTMRSGR